MSLIGNAHWGSRAQLQATVHELHDVQGKNQDGIWNNESVAKSATHDVGRSFFATNPLALGLRENLHAGLSVDDETQTLATFVHTQEATWGQPTLQPDVLARLKNPQLFAAQKAITLVRFDRKPDSVVDAFVSAKGTVDGQAIADRNIFTQHWKSTGKPSGTVVVISPGFLETGRTFQEQIVKLNALGHDVVVMDQQWAGQSDGKPGGIDRGFGIARDVAALAAHAAHLAHAQYGSDGKVVLFGNSMGGGPGVLGASILNQQGRIDLDGSAMPKNLDVVLQAPYLAATPTAMNDVLHFAAGLPFVNRLQAPATGLPDITHEPIASHKLAQGLVLEDVRGQLSSFRASDDDLATLRDLIARGVTTGGRVTIVHSTHDTLADNDVSKAIGEKLGATFVDVDGSDHVLSQSPGKQDVAVGALDAMIRSR